MKIEQDFGDEDEEGNLAEKRGFPRTFCHQSRILSGCQIQVLGDIRLVSLAANSHKKNSERSIHAMS